MSNFSIIPEPQSIEPGEGVFTLSTETVIVATEEAQPMAQFLGDLLRPSTGFELPVVDSGENAIRFELQDGEASEGYSLNVSESEITISATTAAGLFYGIQTLRQLLPASIESHEIVADTQWTVPVVTITDAPHFAWRGLHLDVGRHFFGVDFVKKFIDLMVLYKFNIFHWHLTEDQGWRIEIKQYPELTEIGSKRKETPIPEDRNQGDGVPYEGHYTQDEVREVVAYATERAITIVPEIEMPGHAVAVLATYPELGCVGEGYEVETRWGIFKDVFCAGKEEVFTFLENVLTEVLDLFPSEYIHIGGDECPKDRWEVCPDCQARIKAEGLQNEHELQSYFIRRMEKWLNERGRRLVGWDEILEGGLAPNATVMSWRGSQGGIDAANAGHDVIMSPNTSCYLD
ncbi:MAG: beta-N-acetylhexosaminidase, partial [Aggregatilineales bacterium]